MHEVLVNRLGGLSLPSKSVVRLTDRPDMTLDVYHGRKTTIQQQQQFMSVKEYTIAQLYMIQLLYSSHSKELFICQDKLLHMTVGHCHCSYQGKTPGKIQGIS